MFEELLPLEPGEEELPYDLLVDKTEGYSGSDIRLVCKEAAMQPLRRLMTLLEDKEEVVPEDGMWLQLYDPWWFKWHLNDFIILFIIILLHPEKGFIEIREITSVHACRAQRQLKIAPCSMLHSLPSPL